MSKKRKTRKEKIRSMVRQSTQSQDSSPVYTFDASAHAPSPRSSESSINSGFTTTHYAYVLHDARQTFIITSIILAASIVFYIILQNHIINLSMLGY